MISEKEKEVGTFEGSSEVSAQQSVVDHPKDESAVHQLALVQKPNRLLLKKLLI